MHTCSSLSRNGLTRARGSASFDALLALIAAFLAVYFAVMWHMASAQHAHPGKSQPAAQTARASAEQAGLAARDARIASLEQQLEESTRATAELRRSVESLKEQAAATLTNAAKAAASQAGAVKEEPGSEGNAAEELGKKDKIIEELGRKLDEALRQIEDLKKRLELMPILSKAGATRGAAPKVGQRGETIAGDAASGVDAPGRTMPGISTPGRSTGQEREAAQAGAGSDDEIREQLMRNAQRYIRPGGEQPLQARFVKRVPPTVAEGGTVIDSIRTVPTVAEGGTVIGPIRTVPTVAEGAAVVEPAVDEGGIVVEPSAHSAPRAYEPSRQFVVAEDAVARRRASHAFLEGGWLGGMCRGGLRILCAPALIPYGFAAGCATPFSADREMGGATNDAAYAAAGVIAAPAAMTANVGSSAGGCAFETISGVMDLCTLGFYGVHEQAFRDPWDCRPSVVQLLDPGDAASTPVQSRP
ncbi:hypothetical protein GX586_12555 [bacterium]|nr:hypothetical protein [bacterium]